MSNMNDDIVLLIDDQPLQSDSRDADVHTMNHVSNSDPSSSRSEVPVVQMNSASLVCCHVCGKSFGKTAYRNKHLKYVHRINRKGEKLPDPAFSCALCGVRFSRNAGLQRHTKAFHPVEGDKIFKCDQCGYQTTYEYYLKRHAQKHVREKLKRFKCSYCDAAYFESDSLKRHEKIIHLRKPVSYKKKCPKCSFVSTERSRTELHAHFKDVHNIPIRWETHLFDDLNAFREWKDSLEKSSAVQYRTESNLKLYVCNRSGNSKKTGRNLRRVMKTFKIGFCPSAIHVKLLSDGQVSVKYMPCHVGHSNEMKYIRLTKEERRKIGYLLMNKTPEDSILTEIRKSLINSNSPQRIHYLTRKDLHNIKKSFNIGNGKMKHIINDETRVEDNIKTGQNMNNEKVIENTLKTVKNTNINDKIEAENTLEYEIVNSNEETIVGNTLSDVTVAENTSNLNNEDSFLTVTAQLSPRAWVEDLKNDKTTSVFHFKPQGVISYDFPSLKEDDYLLIYMSNSQKSMMNVHGNGIVCTDIASGLNSDFNLQLYTLLVLNDSREGFPVAFMFTNRSDEWAVSIFFQKIKEQCVNLTPNVFVSDIEETAYSAWCKIMGHAKLHMYSTSHVLKAWTENLNKIKSREKKAHVYNVLKSLLYEANKETFHDLLEVDVENLMYENEEYFKYFQEKFVENLRYKKWAHCYLIDKGINPDMSFDKFYKVLKQCYIKSKRFNKLDEMLCTILNLLNKKVFEWSIGMDEIVLSSKLKILRTRHKRSLLISDATLVKSSDDDSWEVLSSTGKEFYTVKRIKKCLDCQLLCTHCEACWHEFECSCRDCAVRKNMCIHIHAVARSVHECGATSIVQQNDVISQDSVISAQDGVIRAQDGIIRAQDGIITEQMVDEEIFLEDVDEDEPQICEFREKFEKFVDFCYGNVKSRKQIAYLEEMMEQIKTNVYRMSSSFH